MEYKGKLYGKIGDRYFDTSHTTEDWDRLISRVKELEQKLQGSNTDLLHNVSNCVKCGEREGKGKTNQCDTCLMDGIG